MLPQPGAQCREAGSHLDDVSLKLPKPRALQASFGEAPGGGVASFHAKVLEVGDHGRDGPFDESPSLGRRQQLGPGDLPEAVVLLRHSVRKHELVQGAPVLQDHRLERVAAVAFPRLKTTSTLPSCCRLPA